MTPENIQLFILCEFLRHTWKESEVVSCCENECRKRSSDLKRFIHVRTKNLSKHLSLES